MEAVFAPSQVKKPAAKKINSRQYGSRQSENLAPLLNSNIHGGVLFATTPPLYYSCLPSPSFHQHIQIQRQQEQKPPLHPFPVSRPKKPTQRSKTEKRFLNATHQAMSFMTTTNDQLKDVSRVLSSASSNRGNCDVAVKDLEGFSDSVFTFLSPPPSSLPFPKFSIRPKLSCTAAEAAGIDAGATDNLRRLLRLP